MGQTNKSLFDHPQNVLYIQRCRHIVHIPERVAAALELARDMAVAGSSS
jgi:hypothetical protein